MQYITEQAMADQLYQRIATKIHFDKTFPEGVLRQDVPNKIWLDYSLIETMPHFTIVARLAKLVEEQHYIIALHPNSIAHYKSETGVFPIIKVVTEETLEDIGEPPKGSRYYMTLLVCPAICYIFNESLDWLIYCDRDYELCMLCCFNQALYPAVERAVKAGLMETFNDDELVAIEEFFDPIWYDYLNKKQIEDLIALYK